ncbi:MAG: 16S rRNA (cytosine(1402)-N(4))-methyltransferase RsmH [Acidobacteria bacterium]|nr:16S rRNA (cytosine(1402)-N(4))-methyltransferase RsmH [Acidobacteriota bacterium]
MAETGPETAHLSVLPGETVEVVGARNGGVFVDATLGLGGHTEALLEVSREIKVIALDQDPAAIDLARKRLKRFGTRVEIVQANFSDIRSVVGERKVDGIIADLGVSSMQLDSPDRGFSFRYDAPLDMRMDPAGGGETAAELLERIDETSLANIIYQYGEERHSRRIARRIIERREAGEQVMTTSELAELVKRSVPFNKKDRIHPATRTFQALRIAVNGELEILDGFISEAVDLLKTNGRLAIITFHSLEDRIVKRAFQRLSGKCSCPPRMPKCVCGAVKSVEILTKKPIVPSAQETDQNPRSRSAKLRAVQKLERELN